MSTIGTSPDFGQNLEFLLSRLISGFYLDQINTRFESGLSLDKIQILVLKLKNLENWKLNLKIRKFWKLRKFQKFEKLKIFEILHIFKFFDFFLIFRFFFNFSIFLNFPNSIFSFLKFFNFKTEIWILSRPSPDQNLDIKKSRLWT